jgi:hypothetical protein
MANKTKGFVRHAKNASAILGIALLHLLPINLAE